MPRSSRPDFSNQLTMLKDFQRRTAEYAFQRLFLDEDGSHRFLVADEAGLGKTLVARGVIEQTLAHLWRRTKRIDIVYICSNADIARQNIRRLSDLAGIDASALSTRITLLPTQVSNLKTKRANFVSITPGTSFELRSALGTVEERALLYVLLHDLWKFRGVGPRKVLRGNASLENFDNHVAALNQNVASIDQGLWKAFRAALRRRPRLRTEFQALSESFRYDRKGPPANERDRRARLVGQLRTTLAATCINALEPDLVILDEFQRFKHLLSGDSEAAQLARSLFEYSSRNSKVRLLLLSATPYKMYTLAHESSEDDHYRDLLDTLSFLFRDKARTSEVGDLLQRYRHGLYRLAEDWPGARQELSEVKQELESRFRSVMARTERLASSEDRNGMLRAVPAPPAELDAADVRAFLAISRIGQAVKQPGVLEYWKAAPYLVDMMDSHYRLKSEITAGLKQVGRRDELLSSMTDSANLLFPWAAWRRYGLIDPGNHRLRSLFNQVIDTESWRLLWVPPSLPYYELGGAFTSPLLKGFTKRLIFSAWQVVPKAVAALLSYEAERRMVLLSSDQERDAPENSPEARRRRRPLLRFARDAADDNRLTGMSVLTMLYPSLVLAEEGDPLRLGSAGSATGTARPSSDLLRRAAERMRSLLAPLAQAHDKESLPIDEKWYWAAPIILDRRSDASAAGSWFGRSNLAGIWSGETSSAEDEEDSRWAEHVREAVTVGESALQAFPDDLAEVLALQAVASPAVCALRAIARPAEGKPTVAMRDAAAQIAWGFRSLFNQPEAMSLLRGASAGDQPYWRRVLEYSAEGCLQAVLDEHLHMLRESLALAGKAEADAAARLAEAVVSAVTLRTANVAADELLQGEAVSDPFRVNRMRLRFGLRFGDSQSDDGKVVARASQVREAFNSPFWPFVLATTSVGQEGLDFHPYCHAIVHWDLPSNPVDLEQREGRVHRYKGHAVRKNVAAQAGADILNGYGESMRGDPWERMFESLSHQRPEGASDIVPFWVYQLPGGGGAAIERHVPLLPLSRDVGQLSALRRSLAVYRMAFGQPRQDDLVEHLLERLPQGEVGPTLADLQIDLTPKR